MSEDRGKKSNSATRFAVARKGEVDNIFTGGDVRSQFTAGMVVSWQQFLHDPNLTRLLVFDSILCRDLDRVRTNHGPPRAATVAECVAAIGIGPAV